MAIWRICTLAMDSYWVRYSMRIVGCYWLGESLVMLFQELLPLHWAHCEISPYTVIHTGYMLWVDYVTRENVLSTKDEDEVMRTPTNATQKTSRTLTITHSIIIHLITTHLTNPSLSTCTAWRLFPLRLCCLTWSSIAWRIGRAISLRPPSMRRPKLSPSNWSAVSRSVMRPAMPS